MPILETYWFESAEIIRLAKREVRAVFRPLKRKVWQMRTKLSLLSKALASLNQMAKELHIEEAKPKLESTPEEVKALRINLERISRFKRNIPFVNLPSKLSPRSAFLHGGRRK